jgi:hypothetical protein
MISRAAGILPEILFLEKLILLIAVPPMLEGKVPWSKLFLRALGLVSGGR